MKTRIAPAEILLGAMLLTSPALQATELDLSGWQEVTLDLPGGQGAANWVLDADKLGVTQTQNADPSFFLNDEAQGAYTLSGSFRVNTTSDDDYIGFAFGWQNSSNFYLFDWKQSQQDYEGQRANEGMTIKRFTGATGDGLADLTLGEFWENRFDVGDMAVLATQHGSTEGWANNRTYTFGLEFNLTPGTFRVMVKDGETLLWDQTVADATFTSGQFAFYNNSQAAVAYAGFTQDVLPPPIPEPGTWVLLLAGGPLLGWHLRRAARRH